MDDLCGEDPADVYHWNQQDVVELPKFPSDVPDDGEWHWMQPGGMGKKVRTKEGEDE